MFKGRHFNKRKIRAGKNDRLLLTRMGRSKSNSQLENNHVKRANEMLVYREKKRDNSEKSFFTRIGRARATLSQGEKGRFAITLF